MAQIAAVYDEPRPFTSLSVGFQLPDGVPDGVPVFAVPLAVKVGKTGCYFGYLRSPGLHHTTPTGIRMHPGSGFVFTRFGTAAAEYVRPADGGLQLLSDHEGPHVSARRPHQMAAGRHEFRVTVTDRGKAGGQPVCWLRATVRCPDGKEVEVGSLRFDTDGPTTGGVLNAFLEVTGRADRPPPTELKLPPFRMAVGGWAVDDKPAGVNGVWVSYPQQIPQRAKALLFSQLPADRRAGLHPGFQAEPAYTVLLSETDWVRSPFAIPQTLPQPDVHKHLAPPWVVRSEWLYKK